jgi:segregation and condensation protein B
LPESDRHLLLRDLEALLFAAGRPLGMPVLTAALAHHGEISAADVDGLLAELARRYPVDGGHGFELAQLAEGWILRTNRLAEQAVMALGEQAARPRLSNAALETLAIVAYCQPVSRPEIAEVRGVNSDSTLQTLLDRGLVAETGRRPGPGGAVLYATTESFQVLFGLESLSALPALADFEPAQEAGEELRRRLGLTLPD